MQSLCTLRDHCRQWPRNTRYQADATPYLGRTSTGWIAPAYGWRTHSITSSARASSVIGTAMPGSFLSRPLVPCDDRIPPRAHAFQALKVAVHHLKRCAQHLLLCTRPQVGGRRVLTAESAKQSVMPPETCDARQLLRLPVGVVDVAPTPAILDKKIRRRVHIERCHEIIVVAAERRDNLLAVHERQVVALADVVKRIQFDHQVMHSIYRCLNECKAMMARINVQKIGAHRSPRVVADAEAKQVTVECQCCRYVLHKHQDVPHAEWTSSEARNHAARAERRLSHFRSVKGFQPIARRIIEGDQARYEALVGERRRLAPHCDARVLQSSSECVKRLGGCDLPTKIAGVFRHRTVDH